MSRRLRESRLPAFFRERAWKRSGEERKALKRSRNSLILSLVHEGLGLSQVKEGGQSIADCGGREQQNWLIRVQTVNKKIKRLLIGQ